MDTVSFDPEFVGGQMLGDMKFLDSLREFDKEHIPPPIMKKIRERYISNPDYNPAIIKNSSSACEGLCKWVRAIDVYDEVNKVRVLGWDLFGGIGIFCLFSWSLRSIFLHPVGSGCISAPAAEFLLVKGLCYSESCLSCWTLHGHLEQLPLMGVLVDAVLVSQTPG